MGTFVLIVTAATMVLSAVLGFLVLTRMKSEKREYIVMAIFCIVVGELGYILEMLANTADGGLTAMRIMYLGFGLVAPLFLMFVQKYCDRALPKAINILIFVSALAIILLQWTTDRHLLFYSDFWYDDVSAVNNLAVVPGPLYLLNVVHPTVCVVLSVAIILSKMRSVKRGQRTNLYLLIFGALTPVLAGFLFVLGPSLAGANYGPIFFGVSILILYWGLFRHDLMENEETLRSKTWLRDMIAHISHDLRTPLSVLSVNLETLLGQAETQSSTEYQRQVRAAYQKNLDLQRLTNNLFQVTRIEAGSNLYSLQWVSLLDLLVRVKEKHDEFLDDREILFDITVSQDREIAIDPQFIYSVFDNVIYNAARHTPNGGSITISTENREAATVVTITDTGSGVAPEHLPHIFERFYKGGPARGSKEGESGLGLYIVKSIMEGSGGSVAAQGEEGSGLSIVLSFPVKNTS